MILNDPKQSSSASSKSAQANPRRILVTGATGFLGRHVLAAVPEAFRPIAGISPRQNAVNLPDLESLTLDLADPSSCARKVQDLHPDGILHLAAMADTGACELDPSSSERINVQASAELARAAQELNIPFVFCSTDLVFGGDKAPYRPADPVAPLMVYGQHKAQAEFLVSQLHSGALIARLPLMYGHSDDIRRGLVPALIAKLKSGQNVHLFEDEARSVAAASHVARGLWQALDWPSGIWHFGGPDPLSRYAFGLAVARHFGLESSLIIPSLQADHPGLAPRPKDVSLDSSASYARGWEAGFDLGG